MFAAAALLCTACAPEGPPLVGRRAWVGTHVEVWASYASTICEGSFEALDRHAELLQNFSQNVGVEAATLPYRYNWISSEELDQHDLCPGLSGPCFHHETIYAPYYSGHELVHAAFASGHSSLIDEGLATMLGDPSNERVPLLDVEATFDATQGGRLDPDAYEAAAKLVRAAQELYPDESLPALMETDRDDGFAEFSDQLQRADIETSAVLNLYQEDPGCRMDAVRVGLSECAGPPTPWTGDEWRASGELACDSDTTIGPSQDDAPLVWQLRSIEVAQAGDYTARLDAGDGTLASMTYCDSELCGSGFGRSHNATHLLPGGFSTLELDAGRYWFRVVRPLASGADAYQLTVVRGWHAEDPRNREG